MEDQEINSRPSGRLKLAKIFAGACFALLFFIVAVGVFSQKQSTHISPIDSQINDLLSSENIKKSYIIKSSDISHATRSRYHTFIFAPKAKTNKQILATAANAAMLVQRENKVQYSSVVLVDPIDKQTPYITVDFAPDKMGIIGKKDVGSRFVVNWRNKLPD